MTWGLSEFYCNRCPERTCQVAFEGRLSRERKGPCDAVMSRPEGEQVGGPVPACVWNLRPVRRPLGPAQSSGVL